MVAAVRLRKVLRFGLDGIVESDRNVAGRKARSIGRNCTQIRYIG